MMDSKLFGAFDCLVFCYSVPNYFLETLWNNSTTHALIRLPRVKQMKEAAGAGVLDSRQ